MSGIQNTPYVFVSYAHKDANVVLPCIDALKRKNINVWYDEGIQAGSEWPEYIAEKVVYCTKFILFISRAYLASQNCKRELNFAISKKKELLSIFIEDVELSPGVEMQLGTYQSLFKNRFISDDAFRTSLCNEHWFDDCKTNGANTSFGTSTSSKTSYKQTYTHDKFANTSTTQSQPNNTPYKQPTPAYRDQNTYSSKPLPIKSRIVAALLAIFLGIIGAHHFYLGHKVKGILCILFFWTYIPYFLGIITGIYMLFMSNAKFEKKYNCIT